MLLDNRRVYAYCFNGYWKDVGTVQSLWEANMDLLSYQTNPILQHEEWGIYTRETSHRPFYLDEKAILSRSLVSEGCKVFGKVENSVLYHGVTVSKGAVIKNSVILPNSFIGENAVINRSIIGSDSFIGANVQLGESNQFAEIALIGNNQIIRKNGKIKGNAV